MTVSAKSVERFDDIRGCIGTGYWQYWLCCGGFAHKSTPVEIKRVPSSFVCPPLLPPLSFLSTELNPCLIHPYFRFLNKSFHVISRHDFVFFSLPPFPLYLSPTRIQAARKCSPPLSEQQFYYWLGEFYLSCSMRLLFSQSLPPADTKRRMATHPATSTILPEYSTFGE